MNSRRCKAWDGTPTLLRGMRNCKAWGRIPKNVSNLAPIVILMSLQESYLVKNSQDNRFYLGHFLQGSQFFILLFLSIVT